MQFMWKGFRQGSVRRVSLASKSHIQMRQEDSSSVDVLEQLLALDEVVVVVAVTCNKRQRTRMTWGEHERMVVGEGAGEW